MKSTINTLEQRLVVATRGKIDASLHRISMYLQSSDPARADALEA